MSTIITPSEDQINIEITDNSVNVNVNNEPIVVNVTEEIIEISPISGAYPLPTTVYSVFGRTGAVIKQDGDYDLNDLGDVTLADETNGDVLTYDGTKWVNKAVSGTGTVTSVGASISGNAMDVSGSPITSVGSLDFSFLGSADEYINGQGDLVTFPSLSGYVPYTGATGNVNLGEHGLLAGQVTFDQTPTGVGGVGIMRWNNTDGTVDLGLKGGNVTLQLGQEIVARVVNKTGADLLESGYKAVRISSAQGQRLAVQLAQANNDLNSVDTIGIVTETIANNQEGFITILGQVKEINTTGSLQGETWTDGDVLYLSPTTAGNITNVKPSAPNHMVVIGYVEYAHSQHGKIYCKVQNGYELEELHDVAPLPYINKGVLYRDTTTNLWKSDTIGALLGYTPANDSSVVHLAGSETITGLKTFDLGIDLKYNSIPNPSASGYVGIGSNGVGIAITTKPSSTIYTNNFYFPSASNNYTFPAASGTLALTSNIPSSTLQSNWTTAYDRSLTNFAINYGAFGTSLILTKQDTTTLSVPLIGGGLTSGNFVVYNGTNLAYVPMNANAPLSYNAASQTFSISQANATTNGYLSSTDWNTFNNKQASGNYITSLTGEATASGPGAASVTLSTSAVTGKLLTGVNITGGSIGATDSILVAFGKVQNQINGLLGGSIFQSTWNANTNSPTLTSGSGTKGYYYIVDVAGSTNLDGITDWKVGDWAIYDGTAWRKVDNTDAVSSVNGFTGAVSLTTSNISEGTNLYYTDVRVSANSDVSANTAARHSAVTLGTANGLSLSTQQLSLGLASASATGALSSTDWSTFNAKQAALSGTGIVKSTSGTITYLTDNTANWDIAYTNRITSVMGPLALSSNTLSIYQASTSVSGYLSSTDWNTFNGKQNALTNPVTGTGTTNYLPKFTGTSTIGNSNLINDASGNLGLGVTPSAWLSGYPVIQLPQLSIFSGAGGGGFIFGNAFLNTSGSFTYQNSGLGASAYNNQGGAHQWSVAPSGTAGNAITFTQAMTLTAAGRLLLGTTTESTYLLDVNGTGRFYNSGGSNTLIVSGTGSPYQSILKLQFDASLYGATFTYDANPEIVTIENYGRSASASNQGSIYFRTKVSNTTPTDVFKINGYTGAATFSSSVTAGGNLNVASNNGIIKLTRASGTYGTQIVQSMSDGSINFQIGLATAGSWRTYMRLGEGETNPSLLLQPNGGNVGIGTTSPSEKLHIYSSASSTEIRIENSTTSAYIRSQTDNLNFYFNSAERMRITSGGASIFSGTVTSTGFASSGISGGSNIWNFGTINNTTGLTLKTTQYLSVNVNGVDYKLALVN